MTDDDRQEIGEAAARPVTALTVGLAALCGALVKAGAISAEAIEAALDAEDARGFGGDEYAKAYFATLRNTVTMRIKEEA